MIGPLEPRRARKTDRDRYCCRCGWFLPRWCIGWWRAHGWSLECGRNPDKDDS